MGHPVNRKLINRVEHKLCPRCQEWKAIKTEFYFSRPKNKAAHVFGYCIRCLSKHRKPRKVMAECAKDEKDVEQSIAHQDDQT